MNSIASAASAEWRKAYNLHIRSAQWRNTRKTLFKMRGKRCEVCGSSASQLELHHLTYERMGRESAKDLLIVCPDCHTREDRKRANVQTAKRESKRMNAAFDTWCENRGVEQPDEYEWAKFVNWMDRQGE
jgi:hypothetical protein